MAAVKSPAGDNPLFSASTRCGVLGALLAGCALLPLDPDSGQVSRPDGMIAAPALAHRWPDATPRVLREGMSREVGPLRVPRLDQVGWHRPHASDHAALYIDLPGL